MEFYNYPLNWATLNLIAESVIIHFLLPGLFHPDKFKSI